MTYLPHQQRVVEERAALGGRIGKLMGFLGSTDAQEVPPTELALLHAQATYMEAYFNVLTKRIALWKETP